MSHIVWITITWLQFMINTYSCKENEFPTVQFGDQPTTCELKHFMIDNLSNLDKTGRRCWIVLFRITGSLVAVCQKASHFAPRVSSFFFFFLFFFFFFFPTTLRGRCFRVLVCTMGGVECPFCCCMRGPDISPSALLISTSFSQNWCLSCLSSACVNQRSKQKNQSKLKTNEIHQNPLKIFIFIFK